MLRTSTTVCYQLKPLQHFLDFGEFTFPPCYISHRRRSLPSRLAHLLHQESVLVVSFPCPELKPQCLISPNLRTPLFICERELRENISSEAVFVSFWDKPPVANLSSPFFSNRTAAKKKVGKGCVYFSPQKCFLVFICFLKLLPKVFLFKRISKFPVPHHNTQEGCTFISIIWRLGFSKTERKKCKYLIWKCDLNNCILTMK